MRLLFPKARSIVFVSAVIFGIAGTEAIGQEVYPSKPIRLISCCAGVVESVARLVGEEMSSVLKQPLVVETRAGASGNIAADFVAKSKPDGYTIFFGSNSTHAANQSLFKSLPFDYVKDFVPIAGVGEGTSMLLVSTESPIRSVAELTSLAKSKPGKLNYGWGASSPRVAMEMYKQLAGVHIVDVPYKTHPQVSIDVIGGRVDMMVQNFDTAMPLVKAGKLRPLAVTGNRRIPTLPDLPTMAEAGVAGYAMSWWVGVWAPAGTPKEIVNQLHATIVKSIAAQKPRDYFNNIALFPMPLTSEQLMKFQISERDKWARIIAAAGIDPQ
jgi:tripartite-type tricarboxylate transporter receptor subunit TctC